MKRFMGFAYFVLVAAILIGCISSTQKPASKDELIGPGDKIGEMTVEQGIPSLPYPYLWEFCEPIIDFPEPASYTSECKVPSMTGLVVEIGWIAKDTKIDANWDEMVWELSIDGYEVSLDDFEWYEFDYPQHGVDNKSRHWFINLMNLSTGLHTLKQGWSSEVAIDDGFEVYQPGTYEQLIYFRVLDKPDYPDFSATAGQPNSDGISIRLSPYTSKDAGLDFLLYLPNSYGDDPLRKWPLMVYLHGVYLRGSTLDLLRKETFPHKLDKEDNFPFIVVSPLGDGGFDFWDDDEMIKSVFTLLDEIQTILPVDPKSIYLIGDGMGGNGVWTLSLRRPEYFAALVPIGGYFGYPFDVPKNICDLKDVPVWAFHGGKDVNVPVEASEMLVDALNACGGNAQLTVKPDMTIDILYNVYGDPKLYDWVLSHSLK